MFSTFSFEVKSDMTPPMPESPETVIPPRPDDGEMKRMLSRLHPLARLISPMFVHSERIPRTDRPLLFVGNHTTYGLLDVPFMYAHLYEEHGIFLRALGDHAHFAIPFWRDWVARWGTVDGTRDNCAKLMDRGECILVFPGGAREVAKRRGEKYQLMWGKRLGFVRMALSHGCTIVPFAALGVEEAMDIVLDADDLMKTPLGRWVEGLGLRRDMIPPLVQGIGASPIPRPERLYFWFGEPIVTREQAGQQDDDGTCLEVRASVRRAIESGIEELRAIRAADPKRHWIPRLGDMLRGFQRD